MWSARDGKRIRKTFGSLAEAKTWRSDAGVAVRKGALRATAPTTIEDAARAFLDGARAGTIRNRSGHSYKRNTLRGYETALRVHVLPDIGALRVGDVRRADVQDLVDRLVASGLGANTIRNAVMPLRVVYRRALDRGDIAVNPTAGVNVPRLRRVPVEAPSPDAIAALIDALPIGDQALWGTAAYAGLRLGELQALTWANVDLASGTIRVEAGWDRVEDEAIEPKSEDGRRKVPVAAVLRDLLVEHRMGAHDGLVFGRTDTQPFAPTSVYQRARVAWKKAGIIPVTLHDLRHACASLMIAAGVNVKALSRYMGHANISVTFDVYGHLMPDNLEEAVGRIYAYLVRADTAGRIAQIGAESWLCPVPCPARRA